MQNPLETFSFTDPFASWWPFIFAIIVGIIGAIRSQIAGPTCSSEVSLCGKTVVLTGGTRGIGLEVLFELLRREATVYLATRDPSKALEIIRAQIKRNCISSESSIKIMELDLTSLSSVRRFAQSLDSSKVDILISNAGIAYQPFKMTEDNIETHLAVNYLAPFLLVHLLKPKIEQNGGRIIVVGSDLHREGILRQVDLRKTSDDGYSPRIAFARSKLALVLMTRYLATQWQGIDVTINVVDPGRTRGTGHTTDQSQRKTYGHTLLSWLLMKTPQQAAQTIIYAATAPELKEASGRYFSNSSEVSPSEEAMDMDLARELYKKSLDITGVNSISPSKHKKTL